MVKISVVIPCYNYTKDLTRSLQTIRNQSVRPGEIIIVDDGSDPPIDKSILGPVAEDLPIILICQDNAGAPAARNTGFSRASGEYVIFWDADLLAVPTMLEDMYKKLKKRSDISFVYSDYYFGKRKMTSKAFSLETLQKQNYIHSSSLVRTKDVVAWDESLQKFQDWDFWLTLAENGKEGLYISKPLFTLIPHKKGISTWLPSFAYKTPWKYFPGIAKKVRTYEKAKKVIMKKHAL